MKTVQDKQYFNQLMQYCELWGINCFTGQSGDLMKLVFSGMGGSIEQLKAYLDKR